MNFEKLASPNFDPIQSGREPKREPNAGKLLPLPNATSCARPEVRSGLALARKRPIRPSEYRRASFQSRKTYSLEGHVHGSFRSNNGLIRSSALVKDGDMRVQNFLWEPAPPLNEQSENGHYHRNRRTTKKTVTYARDGKENESKTASGETSDKVPRRPPYTGKRVVKSAGSSRREVYKTSKAHILFPSPPQEQYQGTAQAHGSSGKFAGSRSRRARSALHREDITENPLDLDGTRPSSWPDDACNVQFEPNRYGLSAFGTPTLALRDTVKVLEKEKQDFESKWRGTEDKLQHKEEEIRLLTERVALLEEAKEVEQNNTIERLSLRVEELEEQLAQATAPPPDPVPAPAEPTAIQTELKGELVATDETPVREERDEDGVEGCRPTTSEGIEGDEGVVEVKEGCEACHVFRSELQKAISCYDVIEKEYHQLEAAYQESEMQRTEFEKRCCFLLLDTDHSGLIDIEKLSKNDIFQPYPEEVLKRCFFSWHYQSGRANHMCWEDFSLFLDFVEDKTTKAACRFWFSVLDVDGDGFIGKNDIRWLYDQVDKTGIQGCIQFQDLLCQLLDMARPSDICKGFTLSELRQSKLSNGIIGILTNHNYMLLRRSTSEWATKNNGTDLPL